MKKLLLALLGLAAVAAAPPSPLPHWSIGEAQRLADWLDSAAEDGLAPVAALAPVVRTAIGGRDAAELDRIATSAAVRLLAAERTGCCHASLRAGWHIPADQPAATAEEVTTALARGELETLFAAARPSHPNYLALRRAYAGERDPATRANLAANLDRWRWMPRQLGTRYLLVNAAAFEATLWDRGKEVGRWEVIVGKTRSPTPVFAATITGVTFNPWWEIPPSIAAESVAGLMRRRPAEAARRGYVIQGGRYRQRPGAENALGRMKLVMRNPFNVYLHDTPTQGLFAKDVRAFSHGCVRVGDALGLATTLLSELPGWDKARTEALVAGRKTVTITLAQPLPVYIAYFTAEPDGDGIRYFPDVYSRDKGQPAPGDDETCPR